MNAKTAILWLCVLGIVQAVNAQQVNPNSKTGNSTQCSASQCCSCSNGIPGVPGVPGVSGVPGVPGVQGSCGVKGERGAQGAPGAVGTKGNPATNDYPGLPNWKQCTWASGVHRDFGIIKECSFVKKYEKSYLRVFYAGNLRIRDCDNCCKRYYFHFDGAECTKPNTIDAVFYIWRGKGTQDIHRHRHIEGYCHVPKGTIKIGFLIGNCPGYGNAAAHAGWLSVSRIGIEELPPPQS